MRFLGPTGDHRKKSARDKHDEGQVDNHKPADPSHGKEVDIACPVKSTEQSGQGLQLYGLSDCKTRQYDQSAHGQYEPVHQPLHSVIRTQSMG